MFGLRRLEKYLDDEYYTDFHQNVCRLAIEALRDRQAKESDSAPGQTRKPTRDPMRLKLDITFATDSDLRFAGADRFSAAGSPNGL